MQSDGLLPTERPDMEVPKLASDTAPAANAFLPDGDDHPLTHAENFLSINSHARPGFEPVSEERSHAIETCICPIVREARRDHIDEARVEHVCGTQKVALPPALVDVAHELSGHLRHRRIVSRRAAR